MRIKNQNFLRGLPSTQAVRTLSRIIAFKGAFYLYLYQRGFFNKHLFRGIFYLFALTFRILSKIIIFKEAFLFLPQRYAF